jgi:hypothetical protein
VLVVAAAAVAVTVTAVVAVAVTRGRDDGRAPVVSAPEAATPVASDAPDAQPGPPGGSTDPATPDRASAMLGLRQSTHTGFDRISIDFGDSLPPAIESVAPDASHGRIRVGLGPPRPTEARGTSTLVVPRAPVVSTAFYVVDRDDTYVDIYTKVAADPLAFRLADVAFTDGSRRGVIVVDLVAGSGPWGTAHVGDGGAVDVSTRGATVHVEGYGVRRSGRGVVAVRDGRGDDVLSTDVTLTASPPANGAFAVDLDASRLPPGRYTVVFTSSDPADEINGQPPATSAPFSI